MIIRSTTASLVYFGTAHIFALFYFQMPCLGGMSLLAKKVSDWFSARPSTKWHLI